MFNIGGLI